MFGCFLFFFGGVVALSCVGLWLKAFREISKVRFGFRGDGFGRFLKMTGTL